LGFKGLIMEARDLLGNAIFNGVGNVITGTPEIVNDFVRKAIGAGPFQSQKIGCQNSA